MDEFVKILLAPQNFKESLNAIAVARAMARGIRNVVSKVVIDLCPMADGGDGTVDAICAAVPGKKKASMVIGPLGEKVRAQWALIDNGNTAVIEMAKAAGLDQVPAKSRDPVKTTTYGVGQLIHRALNEKPRKIIVGIGGSATNDGGTGMAQALGARFYNSKGIIKTPMTGGMLLSLNKIDTSGIDPRIRDVRIVVACDVNNPLTGPKGAAAIYGPQKFASLKKATPNRIAGLDQGLKHLAFLLPGSKPKAKGAGAAGGLGFGLVTFCGAELASGVELILDVVDFEKRLQGADLVLAGEGKIDGQTAQGKTIMGIIKAASVAKVPVIALAGSVEPGARKLRSKGLTACFSICNGPMNIQHAFTNAAFLIAQTTESVMSVYYRKK